MKRIVFLVLVVTLLFSMAAPGVEAAPPGRPFAGAWESIDPWDLSRQQMVITAVGRALKGYHVVYRDFGASVCGVGPQGQPLYAAAGIGAGSATGSTLNTELAIWCLARPRSFWGTIGSSLTYDATTDTLNETWGGKTTVWSQRGSK
jgi:hypothetical protein